MPRRSIGDSILAKLMRVHSNRVLARLMGDARRATAVQDRLLKSLIRANAESAYGVEHGFSSIRNYDDFQARVPVNRYADIAPWVERVKSGDIGAMFGAGQRVHMFAMTSGTADEPKYIPVTDRFLRDLRAGWSAFGIKAVRDHPECWMRPIVQITSRMDEQRTASGLPCGAITGLMSATQKRIVRKFYVAPLAVANIDDATARRYVIMRLAMPVDVSWIVTASPATMLQLARIGETYGESIIRDIRDGTISAEVSIPESVRRALAPRLRPDPAAAGRLEDIRARQDGLRPKDYWQLGFLANWTGGTMGLYLNEFDAWFGGTPIRDIGLVATEGRMSVPLTDGTPAGVTTVSTVFFEFIPAEEYGRDKPVVLRGHQVEVGKEYFILLTTSAGFYRYDICDCVRVVGFEGQAPVIEFLHKGAHVSSITGEKITERQVVEALDAARSATGIDTTDAVLAPRWADPPHYRLYLPQPTVGGGGWSERLSAACDGRLCQLNMEYASKRSSERLGGIEIAVVAADAIGAMDRRRATRHRRANEQFKHQYLYTSPGSDDELSGLATVVAASHAAGGTASPSTGPIRESAT